MSDIQLAVSEGGESLEKFAKVSNMSVDEFTKKFKEDSGEAMYSFIEGLGNIKESGGDVISTLVDLGFSETRVRDMLSRLAGNTDLVRDALDRSNRAWEENSALQNEAELRYQTTASQIELAKNKIQNMGITIGQALLPSIHELLDKVGEGVEWFSELDPQLAANIIRFSTMAVAVGATTTVVGKLIGGFGKGISTVGGFVTSLGKLTDVTTKSGKAITSLSGFTTKLIPSLAGITTSTTGTVSAFGTLATAALPVAGVLATVGAGVYAYHEYNEAMNDSIIKSTEEMSWLEEAFRKLNGVQSYSKEELEDLGLKYEEFSEEISPEFREAVENMRSDLADFNIDMATFKADGVFSNDEMLNIADRFDGAITEAIETIQGRKEEVSSTWQELFGSDGVIEESEQTVINIFNRDYDEALKELEGMGETVKELKRKQVEEGYELTPEEIQMIQDYYNRIKEIELEALVGNEQEQLFLKNKFKAQVATMDAEEASKTGQARKKELEANLLETEAYYDTQIELLESKLPELSGLEREHAQKELDDLKADKELKVQAKREEIAAIYDEMVAGNEQLKGVIDRFTLEVFEGEDKLANDRLNKLKEANANLLQETKTGTVQQYNENKNRWEQITTVIDESTGEITGVIKTYVDETGMHFEEAEGYNREYEQATTEMATKMMRDYNNMCTTLETTAGVTVNANGEIISSNGGLIGSIEQVIDENGNLITSIKDVNGNPIDIEGNWQEVINKANEVNRAIQGIKDKTVTISVNQKGYANVKGSGYTPMYEQGTSGTLGENRLAYINESVRKSRSWELVDGPHEYLGRDSIGDIVNLKAGASVKSNTTSTAMMKQAVQEEVAKAMAMVQGAYFDYTIPTSTLSKMANNVNSSSHTTNVNNNYDDTDLKHMLGMLLGALIDKDTSVNVNLNAKSLAKATAPYMDKELDIRRRRK